MVYKGWCSLAEMRTLERERVLIANDLLDAIDEAEEENRLEAERERAKSGRRR